MAKVPENLSEVHKDIRDINRKLLLMMSNADSFQYSALLIAMQELVAWERKHLYEVRKSFEQITNPRIQLDRTESSPL